MPKGSKGINKGGKGVEKMDESGQEIFYVEKILAEKEVDGKMLYFVKWLGYPSSDNTWEPEESFKFSEILDAWKAKEPAPVAPDGGDNDQWEDIEKEVVTDELPKHLRGRVVENIIGASTNDDGNSSEMLFVVKFKRLETAELLPRLLCNKFYPLDVIRFYESRMEFEEYESNNLNEGEESL